ncbi:juvenile hormone acid O-methyltransferase-like [Photinus pyralis]|uniref:juvenile hormone acid O-methyltransferase-like n=1 Tax=Photinus pyralis TaxID=7054 RepID=UPI001267332F|nr:juvenile hormone acid O-methyltransferase-like [Photinus pyralis]
MENPELYINHILSHQMKYYRHLLDTYFPHILHSTNHGKSVLDIGCGPGKTTHDLILPYLEQEVKEVIGIDISKTMLDYAKKTYEDDRLSFEKVDVLDVPDKFVGRFDYIFSFMTFHWIEDYRKLYSNILKMLKPNGGFLATYVSSSTSSRIIKELRNNEKYAPYCTNYQQVLKPGMPEKELTSLLEDIGFESVFCQVKAIRFEGYSREDLEGRFITINPFYDLVPNHLQKEFLADHVDRVDSVIDDNGIRKYYLNDNLFVVHGRKINSK